MTADHVAIDGDRIERALHAAFGGSVPELVDQLVDRNLCAERLGDGKIGFVFHLGADERPRVRLSIEEEADKVTSGLGAVWAKAAEFAGKYDERYVQAELGQDDVRMFGVRVEQTEGGWSVDGDVLALPSGKAWSITTYDTAPVDKVDGALAERLNALVSAGAKGIWHIRWDGDAPAAVMWVTERPWTAEAATIVQALGGGERLAATRDVLAEGGHSLDPFLVEVYADGGVDVCIWGVRRPVSNDTEADAFLHGDGSANGAAFADRVALTVPVGEQDEARALAGDVLFPAILVARPVGMDLRDHLDQTWRWLIERLADLPPFERLASLHNMAAITQQSAMSRDAFMLGLARYLRAHPDAPLPEGVTLPADLAEADVPALVERAQKNLEAAAAVLELVRAVEHPDLDRIPHVPLNAGELEDTLQRAISGDFTAAEGALHDWLLSLGAGAYDDDPSLASLDDIDLEADAAEAAIEEALAMDDDEDW